MTKRQTHVIVGASVAGAKAAETLRTEGFDGRVVLLGAEPYPPYERPPLSKQLLRGETDAKDAFVHADGFYEDNDIELRVGTRVREIQTEPRVVTVETGESIGYDRLLLATGARPSATPGPGRRADGHSSPSQSRRQRRVAGGLAICAPGRRRGCRVDRFGGCRVDPATRPRRRAHRPFSGPARRVLGEEVGAVYRDLHVQHGVELHLGASVDGFVGTGRVSGVRISDGTEIAAEVVVVGVGVEPRLELARHAGLAIDGGIAVDELLESSAPGVFAAGDVAAAWHPRFDRRIRIEHWANAQNQGIAAAKNMLGAAIPYDRIPYFFSDQYDLGMEYSGYATSWERVVFRGDPKSREFIAFWLADERVVAAMNANVWDVVEPLRALIEARQPVDDSLLVDTGVPIDALVATFTHNEARR